MRFKIGDVVQVINDSKYKGKTGVVYATGEEDELLRVYEVAIKYHEERLNNDDEKDIFRIDELDLLQFAEECEPCEPDGEQLSDSGHQVSTGRIAVIRRDGKVRYVTIVDLHTGICLMTAIVTVAEELISLVQVLRPDQLIVEASDRDFKYQLRNGISSMNPMFSVEANGEITYHG
jgi:hypothetical protein